MDLTQGVPALMVWDGRGGSQLTNVTLIGVAAATGGLKLLAEPLYRGWSVGPDFTFNLDPATTDASVLVSGLQLLNVSGFLIQNVYSIQNQSQPATPASTDDGWWPAEPQGCVGPTRALGHAG